VSVRAGGIDDERGEALHPLVDGGVVNVDAVLGEQFFDVAVGLAVPEVPADRTHGHLWSELEPSKRGGKWEGDVDSPQHASTPSGPPTQQCRIVSFSGGLRLPTRLVSKSFLEYVVAAVVAANCCVRSFRQLQLIHQSQTVGEERWL
jgi:hypothetical protein